MKSEGKQCQNCKQKFIIEPEDFDFYEKIDVPPPTWCPDCRFQRRFLWRNERFLYKRPSDIPVKNEEIISIYAPEKEYTIYDHHYWWSDNWDALEYGREYDFSKPFFEQFEELLRQVPLSGLSVKNMVNSEYCNVSANEKDCYLISASGSNERVLYSNRVALTKDSMDLYISDRNELCYDVTDSSQCYHVLFSAKCSNCVDSMFLYECVNCQNCYGCVNLRNKQYHLFNKPYSKEEYLRKIEEIDLGSFLTLTREKEKFLEHAKAFPRRYAFMIRSVDCLGDNLKNCKNCKYAFDVFDTEDSKFVTWTGFGMKDVYDAGAGGGIDLERLYEVWDISYGGSRVFFSSVIYGSHDVFYSWNCHSSHNLFGCYGLRSKSYCILNKQYSKEEYEKLVQRIRKHMEEMPYVDRKGKEYRYGEFFPPELSPFAYNETIAQEYFPLTKEEAEAQGYRWRDMKEKEYKPTTMWMDLPDNIKDVNDSILEETILCKAWDENPEVAAHHNCTKAYRIIRDELEFYRKMKLPLPRYCFNSRHFLRFKQRNPLKLWHRECQCAGIKSDEGIYENMAEHFHGNKHCPNEFETSYAPERKEIVYCKKCYQSEVV
ncbi:hypothetical protein MYX07_05770 [Patescibacteria group bacterium AH-259-L07]|nr:hypothetical protein [Patescibacteria group bacterium AH-259-L07]